MQRISLMCGNVHFSGDLFSVFVQFERGNEIVSRTGAGKDQTEAMENLYFELFGRKIHILEMETSENKRRRPMASMLSRNGGESASPELQRGEPIHVAAEGGNCTEAIVMALVKTEETLREREQPKPNVTGF